MMDREALQQAVDSKFVPVYASNYAEVKDYYQDKAGQRGWIGAMAQALTGSDARSGKPYLAARRSIERYEAGQFKNMKKYSPEMARVGQTLPPIGKKFPNDTLTLTVKGTQHEKGGDRSREWTATFKGGAAYKFAYDPSYYAFFDALNYGDDIIDSFDGDDSSSVEVTYVA